MNPVNQNSNASYSKATEERELSHNDVAKIIILLQKNWPELTTYDSRIVNKVIDRIGTIALNEGIDAITHERIQGLKEIYEDYFIPFTEGSGILPKPKVKIH